MTIKKYHLIIVGVGVVVICSAILAYRTCKKREEVKLRKKVKFSNDLEHIIYFDYDSPVTSIQLAPGQTLSGFHCNV